MSKLLRSETQHTHSAAADSGYPAAKADNTEIKQLQGAGANWNSAPVNNPNEPVIRSIDELKEALIQKLQIEHTMLATAVNKTLNWCEQDGVLSMSVHTPFEVRQLQQERPVLTQKIATLYGKTLAIHIGLVQETVKTPPIPVRVEMVLRMIKGRIVDIQKKRMPEASEEDE